MCDCPSKRKPHVHAEVIKAWADGAVIQYYSELRSCWITCGSNSLDWHPHLEYRIKPEPTDVEKYGVEVGDVWCIDSEMRTVRRVVDGVVSFTDSRLKVITCGPWFNRLLFRRGEVNKL